MNTTIVKLPYMGVHRNPVRKQPASIEINMSSLRFADVERIDEDSDPLEILMRKVTRLAQLLKCSEAQAEDILFDRI